MTVAQFESVSGEILLTGTPALTAETVTAEVLVTATASLQASAVTVEVLIPSLLGASNLYDSLGVQREAYQWDGAGLIPVTFAT